MSLGAFADHQEEIMLEGRPLLLTLPPTFWWVLRRRKVTWRPLHLLLPFSYRTHSVPTTDLLVGLEQCELEAVEHLGPLVEEGVPHPCCHLVGEAAPRVQRHQPAMHRGRAGPAEIIGAA